jgi:hypothetical protein
MYAFLSALIEIINVDMAYRYSHCTVRSHGRNVQGSERQTQLGAYQVLYWFFTNRKNRGSTGHAGHPAHPKVIILVLQHSK